MSNIRWKDTPQGLASGSPSFASFHRTPACWYILRAISMSRRVRKIGQVRVFGLKRERSSFDIAN